MHAHVFVDAASAEATAEFIRKTREERRKHFHIWQRGELVVHLGADKEVSEEDFAHWVNQVEARVGQLDAQ